MRQICKQVQWKQRDALFYSNDVRDYVKPDSFRAGSEANLYREGGCLPLLANLATARRELALDLGVPPSSPGAHNYSSSFLLQTQPLGL